MHTIEPKTSLHTGHSRVESPREHRVACALSNEQEFKFKRVFHWEAWRITTI